MRTLVVGYFGFRNGQLDGQTVKTRSILELYQEKKVSVDYFDTQILQKNKLYIVFLIYKIFKSKEIIYLPGYNNLKNFGKTILTISRLLKININYFVVGGWLIDFIKENNSFIKLLKEFDCIYVETEFLREGLLEFGIENVKWFPNFRKTEFKPAPFRNFTEGTLRVVFMARVMPEKGIDVLFSVFNGIKERVSDKEIYLDIYGQISENYNDNFYTKLCNNRFISYKGVLEPKFIYENITNYDVLILPTFYEGEGFPGTIVDAYIAGLPVITTKWKQIPEFVDEGLTGFLVEPHSVNEIIDLLLKLKDNRVLLEEMKINAYLKSKEFSYEKALTLV
ncbi:glycosyltransferase family 4 protein [Myroides odoratimimus]|uniref:glycosyltransferase family 4 protein n=1 Tax=Myroides odoratimimus TaxID=76832 RepID=UPI002577AC0C|nr:glycosyltransferase family 4 protein [Myroides odoratimimus]MDM1415683.1 glycosyltransferase family 4 protein [Myroides odoratimimus]